MSTGAISSSHPARSIDWTWPGRLALIAVLSTVGAFAFRAFEKESQPDATELVTVAPGILAYVKAGEFLSDGSPVDPPREAVAFPGGLTVMKRQVSRAEYEQCVAAAACRPLQSTAGPQAATLPAVGLSWIDATAYAGWLSRDTGHHYRLPTDAEWAYVAGAVFRDDSVGVAGRPANPAARWLAAYDKEAAADTETSPTPLPFGSFGVNAAGLQDLGGNVWEWTDTCYVRHATTGGTATVVESCGVRVVEGAHRTYLSDFVRDARGGACSAGIPPANLGVRLVRDGK